MRIEDKPITDIPSLYDAVTKAKEVFTGQVWWRGQRDYSWTLLPSLFRSHTEYDEISGNSRFVNRAYARHTNVPSASEWPNWLFLMQHYRFPTRLLDWTESPLIAAFFASEIDECHLKYPGKIADADGALFALSPYKLNEKQVDTDKLLVPQDERCTRAMAPAFDEHAEASDKVIAVRPAEVDVRLMVQISEFTLNGYEIALEKLPSSDQFILKFRVIKDSKELILKELKRLGVRLSSIFPDLEHLAEEIRQLKFRRSDDEQNVADNGEPGIDDPKPRNLGKIPIWPASPGQMGESDTG